VKTFIDTNVLVYAHDTDAGDKHTTAGQLVARLWDGRTGVLSTQVLQEFYAVVTRKFKPPMPLSKARAIVAAYSEWCDVATEPQLIVAASRLQEEHTLSFWDALIVQAALRAGAERLVSEDLQHGRRFGVLAIDNPFVKA
jgi:predicted nucleic acid-binding protein